MCIWKYYIGADTSDCIHAEFCRNVSEDKELLTIQDRPLESMYTPIFYHLWYVYTVNHLYHVYNDSSQQQQQQQQRQQQQRYNKNKDSNIYNNNSRQ